MQVARPVAGALPVEVGDEELADRTEFLAGIESQPKAKLIAFAQEHYDLKLTGTKEELVAAILNAEAALTK